MTLTIKSSTSPTLTTGAFNTVFGEYERVESAVAMINEGYGGVGDGLVYQLSCTISGQTVTTTILYATLTQATDANRVWAAAADITGKTVSIIADCI